MKFLAVKLERADMIDGLRGYSPAVEIEDVKGSKSFFFLELKQCTAVMVNQNTTAQDEIEGISNFAPS
jgi:hypothetical protein